MTTERSLYNCDRTHQLFIPHPFPNDLKGYMLRHFLLAPEQYETGPAVPVRRTVRQVSGDERRFEASVQPWGQWEPNAHFRVDMRMPPRSSPTFLSPNLLQIYPRMRMPPPFAPFAFSHTAAARLWPAARLPPASVQT